MPRFFGNMEGEVEDEVEVSCPFCGETISVSVDPTVSRQDYIEDCSVCCRPIVFRLHCEDGTITSVEAGRE